MSFRPRRVPTASPASVEPLEGRTLLATTVFADGFEGTSLSSPWVNKTYPGGNPDTRWGVNSLKKSAGSQSVFCAVIVGGSNNLLRDVYAADQQNGLIRDNVSLRNYLSATLTFSYFLNTESGYDYFTVNVIDSSGLRTTLYRDDGNDAALGWQRKVLDVSAFAGQSGLDFEFRFDSDGSVINPSPSGVWVDAVSLTADTAAAPGAMNGSVYHDIDGDGARDVGEHGLSNWTVFLDQNRNGQRDTGETGALTDAEGDYAFTGLAPGTYYVGEQMKAGYAQTYPGPGGDPASDFEIEVNFADSKITPSQRLAFTTAANRWARVITADLPDVSDDGAVIDDLRIDAYAPSIDGEGGVLGQAAPTMFRGGSLLPFRGFMEFDSADLAAMEADGQLVDVIVHEMGHVLGIGTLWDDKGLLLNPGSADPRFTGPNAASQYNFIFGTSEIGVPVENSGGAGTRGSHWRESILNDELMTGYLNSGVNPLSRITVASLSDLGYTVDLSKADTYVPPAAAGASLRSGKRLSGWTNAIDVPITACNTVQPMDPAAPRALASATTPPPPYQHTVVVAAGQTRGGVDFGNRLVNQKPTIASLSDSPDPVAAGGTVTLTAGGVSDPDGSVAKVEFFRETNGTAGLQTGTGGDTLVRTDATASDGFKATFSVGTLAARTYTYYARATDNDGATGTPRSTTNTIKPPSGASLSGTVFNDVNGNRVKDTGDAGLANWRVYLDANKNGKLDTGERSTLSGSTGQYTFTGLAAGTHHLRLLMQSGFLRTTPTSGWHSVTLTTGTSVAGKHFGVARYASVSGRAFNDADADGVQDSGEAGLANWRVYIDRNNNGAWESTERSALTDSTGAYALRDLPPGTYTVREVLQTGWRLITPSSGYHRVTLTSGRLLTGKSFANKRATQVAGAIGTVAGRVFADADGDGRRDTGEAAQAGWRVYLDLDRDGRYDGTAEPSALTDAAGTFGLRDVAAGSYTLRAAAPSGWSVTAPTGAAHAITFTADKTYYWKEFATRRA